MNKRIIVLLIALLWVIVTVGFIASKQAILKSGKVVLLETEPVDPRDLLRGDYVILSYKISNLHLDKIKSGKKYFRHGEIVYVEVEPKGKYWEAISISSKSPAAGAGILIKGRVQGSYSNEARVLYGIENYFVPEGEGSKFETAMRRGSKEKLNVEAVVDKTGNAMIKRVYFDSTGNP
ncbi:MAG: hypothetical protein A2879_02580 [Omnitrophica WOR_2 bacterium RIFCSPHIGHO2_01_FULL_49_10]|nr:MAG: hypothetical protein A2879_02580 [Omnitrophica WOR_2 bacterium RIFCSPHIGHO2_01_FULL_49_10]OGX32934.1 MAG: hypothetical protein A3I43_02125 [Omnitrophica WOR_2 bacterium RIFCSPLOWO2_02_FULL_50_19]